MDNVLGRNSFWERLGRNRDTNLGLFASAGVRPEHTREVGCSACGLWESAVFWYCSRKRNALLQLCCPRCGRGRAWYSLARNAPIEPFRRLTQAVTGITLMLSVVAAGTIVSSHTEMVPHRLAARAEAARDVVGVSSYHLHVVAVTTTRVLGAALDIGQDGVGVLQNAGYLPRLRGGPGYANMES